MRKSEHLTKPNRSLSTARRYFAFDWFVLFYLFFFYILFYSILFHSIFKVTNTRGFQERGNVLWRASSLSKVVSERL